MAKTKLLVVGWDAADWAILNPLLASGKMPALASLLDEGFHGKLASLQPMLSPLLWTSIATGFRAHDHGITNFVEPSPHGDVRAVRGSSRKLPAFWEILKDRGYNSNVVGWWPSHPAEDCGGVMVSNFYNHTSNDQLDPLREGVIFPESLSDTYADLRVHVKEITGRILAPFFPNVDEIDGSDSIVSSVAKIIAQTSSTHAAITEAMATTNWDISAVYYDAIDHFKHLAMKYHPPKAEYVSSEDFEKYRSIVEAGYRFHDMMLDRLLTLAGDDCHVLLVSDHGFAYGEERVRETPEIPGGPAHEHHPYGVLIGKGPQWSSKVVYGTSLLDLCPSILHLFDVPVSSQMPGAVQQNWWKNVRPVTLVEEYTRKAVANVESTADESVLLSDLSALGYIDLPDNSAAAVRSVLGDNQYHTITSMLDAGLWQSALQASEKLCHDYPDDARYAYQKLGILLTLKPEQFDAELKSVQELFPSYSALYFKGIHALRHGYYAEASKAFQELADEVNLSPGLITSIGKSFVQAGQNDEAVTWLTKVHEKYERWPEAAVLLAEMYARSTDESDDETSLRTALDYALEAVQRRYFTPEAHRLIARLAVRLGEHEVAQSAFPMYLQLNPHDRMICGEWITHLKSVGKFELAAQIEQKYPVQTPVVVVTGWPRSGTSMMMQMLRDGGVEVVDDGVREADNSNPHGYLESAKAKQIQVDNRFVSEAKGKAVKLVLHTLSHLPSNNNYKVIWMNRPLTEVILSQEVMLGKTAEQVKKYFPFGKAMQMEQQGAEIFKKLDAMGNVEILEVEYSDCLSAPNSVVKRIERFLSDLNVLLEEDKMMAAIDSKLYRSRM